MDKPTGLQNCFEPLSSWRKHQFDWDMIKNTCHAYQLTSLVLFILWINPVDYKTALSHCFLQERLSFICTWWEIEAGDWNGNNNKHIQISCFNEINMSKLCIFLNRYVIFFTLDSIKLCALTFDFQLCKPKFLVWYEEQLEQGFAQCALQMPWLLMLTDSGTSW
jgi:hypothetical protein